MQKMTIRFPEEVLERRIFVGNCYAVSPSTVTKRFPELRSVSLKGKPHFADFNLVPEGWGGYVSPWIAAMAYGLPLLEEIRLKRMVITDESLELIAKSFKNFKVLVLISCEGFTTDGLAAIASNCRNLKELNLQESELEDLSGHWLSQFPDSYTSLVSLNISCLNNELAELGTGVYSAEMRPEVFSNLVTAFSGCKQMKSLSGFWQVLPSYLPALNPVCSRLTSLNLSYAVIQSSDLIKLVGQCPNLLRLWVLDYIEDAGLDVVAASCKDLQELRVFPSDPFGLEPNIALTEQGLVSSRPNLTRFRLCILEPRTPDYLTLQPLDSGFGAIVEHCKDLRRLSLSGLLTDRVFEYIGAHAKKLEMLSVAFAGDSDLGLHYMLSGCDNLRKLEIRDCPFGDKALLANAAKLETMRSLWMSSCPVSYGACKLLGQQMPRLNVEVIDERGPPDSRPDSCAVEKLYIYRSTAGPRLDMPGFVWTMEDDSVLQLEQPSSV
ncbi:unnamed protein product [Vicia faba]|uniref:Transport inhibitor response 1 domain-containing protein n=1 Tax=Vicia faba TaxID=3906 RepID=A0AAV1AYD2_VICFA|nr:unnamed protein product [Vicia faba]